MIVLSYPNHITIAVKLKKTVGKAILYNGEKYTEAEPTPQKEDLPLGRMLRSLKGVNFQVVYAYHPEGHWQICLQIMRRLSSVMDQGFLSTPVNCHSCYIAEVNCFKKRVYIDAIFFSCLLVFKAVDDKKKWFLRAHSRKSSRCWEVLFLER